MGPRGGSAREAAGRETEAGERAIRAQSPTSCPLAIDLTVGTLGGPAEDNTGGAGAHGSAARQVLSARVQEEMAMATKTVERPSVARTPKQQPKTAPSGKPIRRQTTPTVDHKPDSRRPVVHAALAADRALRRNSMRLNLPIIGELSLPAGEQVVLGVST